MIDKEFAEDLAWVRNDIANMWHELKPNPWIVIAKAIGTTALLIAALFGAMILLI